MSAAARNCPDSHCTLNLLMFQLLCHRFISGYGLRKRPTTPDREIVTLGGMNRQTERRREGKLGVLFTPIKAPELMCNCRLYGSTLSLSASRVPSRGCRKMSRTRRSDPVRCWTEQNITSWLFLTSKQTFSGPLLPEKKKKKRERKKDPQQQRQKRDLYLCFELVGTADGLQQNAKRKMIGEDFKPAVLTPPGLSKCERKQLQTRSQWYFSFLIIWPKTHSTNRERDTFKFISALTKACSFKAHALPCLVELYLFL